MKQWQKWGGITVAVMVVIFGLVVFVTRGGGKLGSSLPGLDTSTSRGGQEVAFGLGKTVANSVMADDILLMKGGEETPNAQDDGVKRLIIKSGDVSMVVSDVSEAIATIGTYAETNGGFVVASNISQYGIAPVGSITVRIPSEKFEQGFQEVKMMGEVKEQFVSGQDVTEEFVDLNAQIKNLRVTEIQFQQIMLRAVKIEDVLAVQRELSNVRGRIEGIEGRVKFLKESAALATLRISLSTDPDLLPVLDDEKWRPFGNAKQALRSMIESLQLLADGIVRVVIFLPIFALYLAGLWAVYRVGKWGYQKLNT